MEDSNGYAVFFFPQALEALGEAIKPYLVDGSGGTHLLCREIDTGGAMIEMTLEGLGAENQVVKLEIMVPTSMVRMIVSAHGEEAFGFGPRMSAAVDSMPAMDGLPAVGPTALPADAPSESLPATADADADAADPVETPATPQGGS